MDDLFHVGKSVRDLRGHLPLKQQTRTLRDMKVPGGIRGDRTPPDDGGVERSTPGQCETVTPSRRNRPASAATGLA